MNATRPPRSGSLEGPPAWGAPRTVPAGRPAANARPLVLVVDDDADVLESVAQLVRVIGLPLSVSTARSGREALAVLSEQRFDLIIADYHMGDMDGVALLEAAQRLQPGVACVLMSGDPHVALERLRSARAADVSFIAKPFGVQPMVDHVLARIRRSMAI